MKSHVTPSNQKCNICDEIFPSATILAEHKLTHCKVVKGNMCVVCKVAMKSEEQFYTHAQQHGFQVSWKSRKFLFNSVSLCATKAVRLLVNLTAS